MNVLSETVFITHQYLINKRRFIVSNKTNKTSYLINCDYTLACGGGGVGGGGGMPFTGSNFCFLLNVTRKRLKTL
jgi:hypothetical protein